MGGRSSSGNRNNTLQNPHRASEKAVNLMTEAIDNFKMHGLGIVVINETSDKSSLTRPKAENPADKNLESELKDLAEANGYEMNFRTETKTIKGVRRELRYGTSQDVTQIKKRIMTIFRRES